LRRASDRSRFPLRTGEGEGPAPISKWHTFGSVPFARASSPLLPRRGCPHLLVLALLARAPSPHALNSAHICWDRHRQRGQGACDHSAGSQGGLSTIAFAKVGASDPGRCPHLLGCTWLQRGLTSLKPYRESACRVGGPIRQDRVPLLTGLAEPQRAERRSRRRRPPPHGAAASRNSNHQRHPPVIGASRRVQGNRGARSPNGRRGGVFALSRESANDGSPHGRRRHGARGSRPHAGGCAVRGLRRFPYGLAGCAVTIIADLNRSAIMLRAQARARSRRLHAGWLGRTRKVTLPACRQPADNATASATWRVDGCGKPGWQRGGECSGRALPVGVSANAYGAWEPGPSTRGVGADIGSSARGRAPAQRTMWPGEERNPKVRGQTRCPGRSAGDRVLEDECHDGRGVLEAVGVVSAVGLDDGGDVAAEGLVALLDDRGVLGDGHHIVVGAADAEDGDLRLGEGGEVVDGVLVVGEGFGLVGEAVCLDALLCRGWRRPS